MIIGFAGKAASGKTTAAGHLLDLLEDKIVILPMALMLREEVESFLRQVGAEEQVPLVFGDQNDKVRVFHVDEQQALAACPDWSEFIEANRDIQDPTGNTAVTIRRLLQWWGTEYRRAQDPDYWTKAWDKKLREYDLSTVHVLVDDVRFLNELEIIKENGGVFARIERPGFNGANDHSSENALDNYENWDILIRNDGDLEHFRRQVEELILPLIED